MELKESLGWAGFLLAFLSFAFLIVIASATQIIIIKGTIQDSNVIGNTIYLTIDNTTYPISHAGSFDLTTHSTIIIKLKRSILAMWTNDGYAIQEVIHVP